MTAENDTRTRILRATWQLMEQNKGLGVSMAKIAQKTGISRQALYLHFASRTDLMVATVQYVDEIKGLDERLQQLQKATSGAELLEICVKAWGNYIPEIYGLARALLNTRDTDDAAAAAWGGCMQCMNELCEQIIGTLDQQGTLTTGWSNKEAAEMLFTLLSIENWESLTINCGWSQKKYIDHLQLLAKRTFLTQ